MSTDTTKPSPWHPGELRIQRSVGVVDRMDGVGRRVIRDYMPDQHVELFEKLPGLFIGLVDPQGWPWAGFIEGPKGFIRSPHAQQLDIAALPESTDPVGDLLYEGAPIGVLGLEFATRRRNRMNGHVVGLTTGGFGIQVEHSYGNCPQYIQTREPMDGDHRPSDPVIVERMEQLTEEAIELIRNSDTLFVASYVDLDGDPTKRQVDASHRGGRAGFVLVEGDTLTIPDFSGNLFFNTLGNISETGRAGVLFVDFEKGIVLQITGTASVDLDSERIEAFQGAERLWSLKVVKAVMRRGQIGQRVALREYSPNSLLTGSWSEADAKLRAKQLGNQWRRFRVERIVQESDAIRSFHLMPEDEAGLLPYLPGQHLPIRVQPAEDERPLLRTYTLSSAPSDGVYRISVKRQGIVSEFIHARLEEGSILEVRAPDGSFVLDETSRRPVVMLSAGVGITPMVAMARHIIYEGMRTRFMRQVYFFHGSRRGQDVVFEKELNELERVSNGALKIFRALSQPEPDMQLGHDYTIQGQLTIEALKKLLPFDDYDFYLCGPAAFMQDMYGQLRALHVADERIFAEAFGPASMVRDKVPASVTKEMHPPSPEQVKVFFAQSGKEAIWQPNSGSLLELAEIRGLAPEFSCRSGTCGSCRTHLTAGSVTYAAEPTAPHSASEVLICQALPAANSERLILEL